MKPIARLLPLALSLLSCGYPDQVPPRNANAEHPELVEHYRTLLFRQWDAHQALAQRFTGADQIELDPEQLQQLRALGYIR